MSRLLPECRVRNGRRFDGYGESMSELGGPGADEPVVEGGTRDRGPIIVVTAISLNRAAREALAERLGPGHIVRDIKEAGNTADIVLVPSVSSTLVGSLRAMFPDAKVLVTELMDDEFGIDFAGPVTRTVSSGVDGYFVVPDLDQLVTITRDAGRGVAGALTSGSALSGLLSLTAGVHDNDKETRLGTQAGESLGEVSPDEPQVRETTPKETRVRESSSQGTQFGNAGLVEAPGREPQTLTLVLSGAPGAGKTTVAWRVFKQWTDSGFDPAMVDLDLLGAARPAPAEDPHQVRLKTRNLEAVWANFRAGGSRCLILAAVVESDQDRELIRAAVGGRVVVCRLHASDATLASRIAARARESGNDLGTLIRRAADLSEQLSAQDVSDFVVDGDLDSADQVADRVLASLRSHLSPVD